MAKKKAAKEKKPVKGTHLDHPKDDGSVYFKMVGGPHDGERWRLYPNNGRAVRVDDHIADWPTVTWDELGYPDRCGDYTPDCWNPAQPALVWKERDE